MKYLQYFIVITALALSVSTAQAQGIKNTRENLKIVADKAGTTEPEVPTILGIAIQAVLSLVGLIFLILMVYAGVLWMTARGEAAQVEKAQDIIKTCIIGLAVIVSAYAITYFVTNRFEGK